MLPFAQLSPCIMRTTRFRMAKTGVFVLLSVVVAGGFAFVFYQSTYAQFQAPCDTPPNCQPESQGGGAGNLLEVLTNEAPDANLFGRWKDPRYSPLDPNGPLSKLAGLIGLGGAPGQVGVQGGRVRLGIGTSTPGYLLDGIAQKEAGGDEQAVLRLGYNVAEKIWTGLRLDRLAGDEKWFVGMDNQNDNFLIKSKANSGTLQEVSTTTISIDPNTGVAQGACIGSLFSRTSANSWTGNVGGYSGANEKCDEGYHVCTTQEMVKSTQCNLSALANNVDAQSGLWFSTGVAYLQDDCSGWTTDNPDAAGAVWFSADGGGHGEYAFCDEDWHKFACCK